MYQITQEVGWRITVVSGCSVSQILTKSVHPQEVPRPQIDKTAGFGFISPLDDARCSIAHTLSCELYPSGIRVVLVVSGPVRQPFLDQRHAFLCGCDSVYSSKHRDAYLKRTESDTLHTSGESLDS